MLRGRFASRLSTDKVSSSSSSSSSDVPGIVIRIVFGTSPSQVSSRLLEFRCCFLRNAIVFPRTGESFWRSDTKKSPEKHLQALQHFPSFLLNFLQLMWLFSHTRTSFHNLIIFTELIWSRVPCTRSWYTHCTFILTNERKINSKTSTRKSNKWWKINGKKQNHEKWKKCKLIHGEISKLLRRINGKWIFLIWSLWKCSHFFVILSH